jgi:hypothetical protein
MPNMNFESLPDKFKFKNGLGNEFVAEKDGGSYKVYAELTPWMYGTWSESDLCKSIEKGSFKMTIDSAKQLEDIIQKPSHYHKNEIDVNGYLEKHFPLEGSYTVAEGFYIGNVIKYTSRYKDKNGLQDLEKAKFNLNKLIELEEKK